MPSNVKTPIKSLVRSCKLLKHRALIFIIGSKGLKQISTLAKILSNGYKKSLSLLWCYQNINETFRFEKVNELFPDELNDDDIFLPHNTFICYSEIATLSHQTFNLAILNDFEGITPQVLAFINGCITGGGMIVFLLTQLQNLDELKHLKMDMHKEYQEELPDNFISLFNKRFALSLSRCSNCLVLGDNLKILNDPSDAIIQKLEHMEIKKVKNTDLQEFKDNYKSEDNTSSLISLCKTYDQALVLEKILKLIKSRPFNSGISFTSPKGCGKSALLGLAVAASILYRYSNIFISSFLYEDVKVVFKFVLEGLEALGYKETEDYDVLKSSNSDIKNTITGINIFRDHRQAIRFINPGDVEDKLELAELVIIDEASSIPLDYLKKLVASQIVLMASSTSGYNAQGFSLHQNIMKELCRRSLSTNDKKEGPSSLMPISDKKFEEIMLNDSIHYNSGDEVEKWLYELYCLKAAIPPHLKSGCPDPKRCQLYYINREKLFNYNNYAESFLQQLMALFFSSKRRNSPEDLITMADAPNHHIFCLLPPFNDKNPPLEIICAIYVHIENKIPKYITSYGNYLETEICLKHLENKTISNCFNSWGNGAEDMDDFLPLIGVHILDIVTHPNFQKMGYGSYALQLLQEYYEGKIISLDETKNNSSDCSNETLSHLLCQLHDIKPPKIEYFLVSFNLTSPLLRFWKKVGFIPAFITKYTSSCNKDSLEQLCFMVKSISNDFIPKLTEIWHHFKEYYSVILSSDCRHFPASLALSLISNNFAKTIQTTDLTKDDIDAFISPHLMRVLEKYSQNLGDFHSIMAALPILSKLYFRNKFKNLFLPCAQEAILLSFGLQCKNTNKVSNDLNLPPTQVHGLLNRTIRKLTKYLTDIIEQVFEKTIVTPTNIVMDPLAQDLDKELEEAANQIREKQIEDVKKLHEMDFSQYAIKGSEDEWQKVLQRGRKTLVSIKSIKRKPEEPESENIKGKNFKHKNKNKKNRKP